ncbi:unnamed protein product (macronuclear) [Paramecium tetraurelia]|uniref:Uncharacterized protein n=1 Tax=Paramecium tetraurelia TaxID=5888 RepID=A0BFE2_PARTE|nr:uncharacterized protein GSPATT00028294001 [Paramecium tetraurelia]CAK57259.1 unnamed protein product [Paramecium tetraurelia]|eukprot:XP_001424657.1 hypothetical protein (macronuclear) [Paramecium tetraurelia strain d4-2]
MSILTLYKSNSRSALSRDKNEGQSKNTPMKLIKSQQQDREKLYNSQIMQNALIESCKKSKENRMNSPTFKVTDTIIQANQDAMAQKSGKKKGIFSGIDSQIDPFRNVHTSTNKTNVKLMMFNDGHYMKKYQQKQTDMQQEKNYRYSIKVFQQEQKQDVAQKKVRKSVPGQPVAKDPILSPDSKVDKKLRISCSHQIEHKEQIESIKTYKHANSSSGFRGSVQEGQKNDVSPIKMRQSNTYKSEMKNILTQDENFLKLFSRTDYKGSDNIKKSKKPCLKMDVPRPISAFAFYEK